jgi:hypothetical protein
MVFIIWSTQNQLAGYSALQALQKQTQPGITEDDALVHLQILGKVKKQAALICGGHIAVHKQIFG